MVQLVCHLVEEAISLPGVFDGELSEGINLFGLVAQAFGDFWNAMHMEQWIYSVDKQIDHGISVNWDFF